MWEGVFLASVACAVIMYMSFWFFVSIFSKRLDVVDTAWGLGFILIAFLTAIMNGGVSLQGGIITLLVFFWGLRITIHLSKRYSKKAEDFRYVAMRKRFGKYDIIASFFEVFLLQGAIMFVVALPIITANMSLTNNLTPWLGLGLAFWILGFFFESIADYEMTQFTANPKNKGKICDIGLWKNSRHPNYFGEIMMWWGIFMISLPSSLWMVTILSPILLTLLITKVSGVPLVEGKFKSNKLYQAYKKKTNMLLPFSFKK